MKARQGDYRESITDFRFSPNQQDAIAYTYDGQLTHHLYRWQIKTGKVVDSWDLPIDQMDGLLAISSDTQTYVYGGDVRLIVAVRCH